MLQGDHVGATKYCEDALVLAGDLGSAGEDLVAEPDQPGSRSAGREATSVQLRRSKKPWR